MGCDIHAHIEFFSKSEYKSSGKCYVHCFSSELCFGRDYILFGLIAGVRHSVPPIIKPRGIPTAPEMSYVVSDSYYLSVVDDNATRVYVNSVRSSQAQTWVSDSYSCYTDDSKMHITNPDFHSATHLTLDELLIIRKMYLLENIQFYSNISNIKKSELVAFIKTVAPRELMKYTFTAYENVSLYATISSMLALERVSEDSDTETRFVCWFDS